MGTGNAALRNLLQELKAAAHDAAKPPAPLPTEREVYDAINAEARALVEGATVEPALYEAWRRGDAALQPHLIAGMDTGPAELSETRVSTTTATAEARPVAVQDLERGATTSQAYSGGDDLPDAAPSVDCDGLIDEAPRPPKNYELDNDCDGEEALELAPYSPPRDLCAPALSWGRLFKDLWALLLGRRMKP